MHPRRRRSRAVLTFLAAFVVLASAINLVHPRFAVAGDPIYPDLQTAPPRNLSIERMKLSDGKDHYLLRFDNIIENRGGRLEIVADLSKSRDLFQNVYDRLSGGNLVVHRRITSDLIFHPTHNHFHVSDFASYTLFKKNSSGVYRNTLRTGSKTSFCILDSIKIDRAATNNPQYTECDARRQGLSAGWGDIYTSGLPDQWIDLGTKMLADGDYAIHSTADPLNRILESNDGNNIGVTQFKIKGGKLVTSGTPAPYCAAKPNSVPVGGTVYLDCTRLTPGETFDIRWRYENGMPTTSATVDANGELFASFVMPPSTRGAHYAFITSRATGTTYRAVVDTLPSIAVKPASGMVGQKVPFTLAGFSSSEKVTVSYEQTPGVFVKVATVTTDSQGNGAGTAVVPSSAAGNHLVSATGARGSTPAMTTFTAVPELKVQPISVSAGGKVRPWLRGFGNRDAVVLKIRETGATLKTVSVSRTGAANPSLATEFVIPANLAPGVYHVVGTGSKSGATAVATLTVTGVTAAETKPSPTVKPTKTAVPKVVPTATVTPTATATPTPEPAPTDSATPAPTETAEAQVTVEAQATVEATAEPGTPTS